MTDAATPDLAHLRDQLVEAALPHVAFDGWSEASLRAAIRDTGVDETLARAALPRGAVDLARAFHAMGDRAMEARLAATDLSALRLRDKIATAVRYRLEAVPDREAVRRASTLFALPQYSADGAVLLWNTADRIWTALGDSSDDVNWYTKRASLSAVYAATVLYWLGDESEGATETWAFLDRRIEDVMQFEKLKAQVQDNPVLKTLFAGPNWILSQIKAPKGAADMPGRWPPAPGA